MNNGSWQYYNNGSGFLHDAYFPIPSDITEGQRGGGGEGRGGGQQLFVGQTI